MKKNIALFGGSFDPVHIGHLITANIVQEKLNLDSVIFIPSAKMPHKDLRLAMFTFEERYKLLQLSLLDYPFFSISDIENTNLSLIYTIDTVKNFIKMYPNSNISFIIGTDNLYDIKNWKNYKELLDLCTIIVINRPYDNKYEISSEITSKVKFVDVPLIGISATEIRNRLNQGKHINNYVNHNVNSWIKTNK